MSRRSVEEERAFIGRTVWLWRRTDFACVDDGLRRDMATERTVCEEKI